MPLTPGKALFWHRVYLTQQRSGPVPMALVRCQEDKEAGFVVSDEPTEVKPFEEYGWRFEIEEKFLDDTSNGFPLESSLLRAVAALERRCLVLALTTLSRVAQGTEVVPQGKRRWVDLHGFQAQSSLNIGWPWVTLALSRGDNLVTRGP